MLQEEVEVVNVVDDVVVQEELLEEGVLVADEDVVVQVSLLEVGVGVVVVSSQVVVPTG